MHVVESWWVVRSCALASEPHLFEFALCEEPWSCVTRLHHGCAGVLHPLQHRCAILSKRHTCRRERRRKLGLPEELTEEEKAAERARAEEEAAREAAKRLPVRPVTKIAKMREILVQMKKASAGEEVRLHTHVWRMGACVVCMQVEIAPLCSTLACGAQELNLRCQSDM